MIWTVVRFPNGSWSYGGKPTDPDYAECEIWRIEASNGPAAVRKAQVKRSRDKRKGRAQLASLRQESAPIAEKVPCETCKGTGGTSVKVALDWGAHACADCNGKGYSWEPVGQDSAPVPAAAQEGEKGSAALQCYPSGGMFCTQPDCCEEHCPMLAVDAANAADRAAQVAALAPQTQPKEKP